MTVGAGNSGATLVITNDFPPRIGGIESFVATACQLLDDEVVVLCSNPDGAGSDDTRGYPVHRHPTQVLLPTPAVAEAAQDLIRAHRCRRVLFGAAAPLALLAPRLRAAGVQRIAALSHGHEVWWAKLPATRHLLRRIGAGVDALGYISEFTAAEIGAALAPADRHKLVRVPPPVDLGLFTPSAPAQDPPRIVAAGRYVPAKGWDTLLDAWHEVQTRLAGDPAVLELIGAGRLNRRLQRRIREFPAGTVRTREAVPHQHMPRVLAGARAFALPVRSRAPGLEPEGLGMVFVEAAACGLPVLAGRSGGTGETVVDGETGWCLDPWDVPAWADRITQLIQDPVLAARMGARGRAVVAPRFATSLVRSALRKALDLDDRLDMRDGIW